MPRKNGSPSLCWRNFGLEMGRAGPPRRVSPGVAFQACDFSLSGWVAQRSRAAKAMRRPARKRSVSSDRSAEAVAPNSGGHMGSQPPSDRTTQLRGEQADPHRALHVGARRRQPPQTRSRSTSRSSRARERMRPTQREALLPRAPPARAPVKEKEAACRRR